MKTGWIKIDRKLLDHPTLSYRAGPYDTRSAWIWLVCHAVWQKQHHVYVNGKRIKLERGQLSYSLRFLAEEWHWKKSAVSRFLERLQRDDMIKKFDRKTGTLPGTLSGTLSGTARHIITICNYSKYQDDEIYPGHYPGQLPGLQAGHIVKRTKEIKNIAKRDFVAEDAPKSKTVSKSPAALTPQNNPDQTHDDTLPYGWELLGQERGIDNDKIYKSWKRFIAVTRHPYQRHAWALWIGREHVAKE